MTTTMGRTKLFVLAFLACAGLALALVPGRAQAAESGTCQNVSLAVRLAPLLPKNQTAAGTLCLPDVWAPGAHRVDVLVHGGSYNRYYWDVPVDFPAYSYVERTLQEGRATFAYDRLGTGASSRPLSLLATGSADAFVLHQLVSWLRGGAQDFDKVNLVGHSFGSSVATLEAAIYRDVDLVVLTGWAHATGPAITTLVQQSIPAEFDPKFAGQGYDLGYLSLQPGTRGQVFYNETADPDVVAYDEAARDVLPSGQFFQLIQLLQPPFLTPSDSLTNHILVLVGDEDEVLCGLTLNCTVESNVVANETPHYSSAASLTVGTVANTGHNLALHPTAGASFNEINAWIESH